MKKLVDRHRLAIAKASSILSRAIFFIFDSIQVTDMNIRRVCVLY